MKSMKSMENSKKDMKMDKKMSLKETSKKDKKLDKSGYKKAKY